MKRNKLAVNFAASIITYGMTALINFFLSPYIVASAGEAAYGFVSLATTFTTYATIISTAINSMSGRFVMVASVQDRKEEANQYYISAMIADCFLGILFFGIGTVMVLSLDKMLNIPLELVFDVKVLFALVFISFIVNTIGSVFEIGYFITNKLYLSSLRNILTTIIKSIVVVLLFATLSMHIYYMGIAAVAVTLIAVVYNAYMSKRLVPFIRYTKEAFSMGAVKDIASAGIWNSINLLGTTLTEGLDLLICNIYLTPELMGVMSLSKTIPTVLKSVQATLVGIFTPETVAKYAQNDFEGMKQYLRESMRIMRMTLCVPFGVFAGLAYPFYALWLPTVDTQMLVFLSLLSIMAVIFAIGVSPVYNVFSAANKLKLPSIAHLIGGALSTGIVIVLLRTTSLGVYAVAGVSSLVDIIKTFLIILPFAAGLIGEKPTFFWPNAGLAALLTIAVALPGWIMGRFLEIQTWLQLIVLGLAYALLAYAIILGIGLSPDERLKIKNKIIPKH